MNKTYKITRTLLEEGIHPRLLKVEAKLIEPLLREYWNGLKKTPLILRKGDAKRQAIAESLIKFLYDQIDEELNKIAIQRDQYTDFNKRYDKAFKAEEKEKLIIDFAQTLGAKKQQLQGDQKAFSRWFGQDAMIERYQRRQSMSERKLAFCLQRINVLMGIVLSEMDSEMDIDLWLRLDLENRIEPLLHDKRDSRTRLEAFRCLATALKKLPVQIQEDSVTPSTLQLIYRASVDNKEDIWIQCEAIKLVENFSPEILQAVLKKRFETPSKGDDLFVRKQAVQILGQNFQRLPELLDLIQLVIMDSSPFVRQALPKALTTAPVEQVKTHLRELLSDKIAQVRAAVLLEIPHFLSRPEPELEPFLLKLLLDTLNDETNSFVLRVALKVAVEACQTLSEESHWMVIDPEEETIGERWQKSLLEQIEKTHTHNKKKVVRRWAAQAAEQLWCEMEPKAKELRNYLERRLYKLKPEQRRGLAKKPLQVDETTLARVLSVLSQKDFGYDIIQNWFSKTIIRGHLFCFRWWRFIHEILHPSPDKRQGFRHTVGRSFPGQLRIPSGILCEIAETKVPGEPLYIQNEDGWRSYLPLVDEVIDCLRHQREVKIYTSEGITTLKPPKSWRARFSLTRRFAHYAQLRNWNETSPAQSYIKALQDLGFKIDYQTHSYPSLPEFKADPAVQRFFPVILPFSTIGDIEEFWSRIKEYFVEDFWLRLKEYFFSIYQNNILELGLFAATTLLYFFSKHLYANILLNRSRANIPLVLGGWGTRGKSGVERLKAAMFNALGYSIFSKTTGCEAMFLHSNAFEATHEMFLFRPYDKATIWEHHYVLRLAEKMNKDIFLWECMGLTPAYINILQKQWTRDDISTITNTYPDHEDLQGPAGINIPQVMTHFIPRKSILITSEEQMLPILQAAAEEFKTRLRPVTWLQSGLLTPDILERFPYEEHPNNIALVLAVADELGIQADFALKEMATVVPDLGVLKSYPIASMQTRKLEFVMGMSANERFGCLTNWKRMKFQDQDYEAEPHKWISTLVNNRADRIARSHVFANILVKDISVDQHFLIGTNLTGLLGYIREAWKSYADQQTLWAEISPHSTGEDENSSWEENQKHQPLARLEAAARTFRIPITQTLMQARLRIMLNSQGDRADIEELLNLWQQPDQLQEILSKSQEQKINQAIIQRLKQDVKNYEEYHRLVEKINRATGQQIELETAFRQLLWQWFENKLVVIHDPHISGNQIIKQICTQTPPGFHNRIMGMQNIKGTGLDFVYRWQAYETCHQAANKLKSSQLRIAEEGLNTLVSFKEYGPLSEEFLPQIIKETREKPIGQMAHFQAIFTSILSNLRVAQTDAKTTLGDEENKSHFFQKVVEFLESILDGFDGRKRRQIANQIYKDMITERIGHQTAALELQKLNKRQKGGWLMEKIRLK